MTTDHPYRPGALRQLVIVGVKSGLRRYCIPLGIEQREIQWQVKARVIRTIEMSNAVALDLYLAPQQPPPILVKARADVLEAMHRLRPIIGEHGHVALRRWP